MAAIIRVKRRVDEDPAEALIISCKRPRQDPEILNTKENLTLTYAGTLSSKVGSSLFFLINIICNPRIFTAHFAHCRR